MGKVRVRYQDGTEEELVEVSERNGNTINIYHRNSKGDFISQYLPPHRRLEVHHMGSGLDYRLGDNIVHVIRLDYP